MKNKDFEKRIKQSGRGYKKEQDIYIKEKGYKIKKDGFKIKEEARNIGRRVYIVLRQKDTELRRRIQNQIRILQN